MHSKTGSESHQCHANLSHADVRSVNLRYSYLPALLASTMQRPPHIRMTLIAHRVTPSRFTYHAFLRLRFRIAPTAKTAVASSDMLEGSGTSDSVE